MKKILMLLTLSILSISNQALAEQAHKKVQCDDCYTYSNFEKVVKENANPNSSTYVSVLNTISQDYRKYDVSKTSTKVCDPNSREPDGRGGFIIDCWFVTNYDISEESITTSDMEIYNEIYQYAEEKRNVEFSISSIDVPLDSIPSGWDLIGQPYLQQDLENILFSHNSFSDFRNLSTSYLQMIAKTVGITSEVPGVEFVFSDKSKIYLQPHFMTTDNEIVYKLTLFVDADGNRIDLTQDVIKQLDRGVFKFTSNVPFQSFKQSVLYRGYSINPSVPKTISVKVTITDCIKECKHVN